MTAFLMCIMIEGLLEMGATVYIAAGGTFEPASPGARTLSALWDIAMAVWAFYLLIKQ